MWDYLRTKLPFILGKVLGFTPWLLSMYLLYVLDSTEVWNAQTESRDVMTIAILATGMSLSFLLLSYLGRRCKTSR